MSFDTRLTVTDSVSVPCNRAAMASVRAAVRDLAARSGIPPAVTNDLVIAVNEAATNAVIHGNCRPTAQIVVGWRSDGRCAEVRVEDQGVFRTPPAIDARSLAPRGRGIPLMLSLMDEVHIEEGTEERPGTTIRLLKCWDPPGA